MSTTANNESDAIATLLALGAEPLRCVDLNQPASETAIRTMQAESVRDMGVPVPDGYLQLLRATDGVQINGAYFKSAEYLVAENLDVHHLGVIVIGNSGNNAMFVFDTRDSRFHIVGFGFPDERHASFETFDAMLWGVMREQGVT